MRQIISDEESGVCKLLSTTLTYNNAGSWEGAKTPLPPNQGPN